jgi:hypothetical protein
LMPRTQLKLAMSKPTYTPVKTYEEEVEVRAMIDALRAKNGRLLRGLLKTLGGSKKCYAKDFLDLLVHHPNLRDLVPH